MSDLNLDELVRPRPRFIWKGEAYELKNIMDLSANDITSMGEEKDLVKLATLVAYDELPVDLPKMAYTKIINHFTEALTRQAGPSPTT